METLVKTTPKTSTNSAISEDAAIFLTDYASYNDGSQFEFGHWVKLNQFEDADELNAYISKHFKNADKKSPLGFGSIREEIMISPYQYLWRCLLWRRSRRYRRRRSRGTRTWLRLATTSLWLLLESKWRMDVNRILNC